MSSQQVVIAGGGAAGFFAAITCAENAPGAEVILFEKGAQFLSKVRISGGGRCNVTHACFDVRELTTRYPRGGRALISALHRFQPRDTVAWFESRGVRLKVEPDGRMFPTTDSSQTIIDCLVQQARKAGVRLVPNRGVEAAAVREPHGFRLQLSNGEILECDRLMLATGGMRTEALGRIAMSLGHTIETPVPSLFTFQIAAPWLPALAGISVDAAELSVPGTALRERGALLITHAGLSGPAVLRLSAWGARVVHDRRYHFALQVNWIPQYKGEAMAAEFQSRRAAQPAKCIVNTPLFSLPARLWAALVAAAGIHRDTRWADLSRAAQHGLVQQLQRTIFDVTGKSLNKEEFVTCGGVRLNEVDFRTMQSRICPGLFFGGEILDIDGITGGFNFQAAWTTGWIAGQAMAKEAR